MLGSYKLPEAIAILPAKNTYEIGQGKQLCQSMTLFSEKSFLIRLESPVRLVFSILIKPKTETGFLMVCLCMQEEIA